MLRLGADEMLILKNKIFRSSKVNNLDTISGCSFELNRVLPKFQEEGHKFTRVSIGLPNAFSNSLTFNHTSLVEKKMPFKKPSEKALAKKEKSLSMDQQRRIFILQPKPPTSPFNQLAAKHNLALKAKINCFPSRDSYQ